MSCAGHILYWLNLEVLTQANHHRGRGCVKHFQMWPFQINKKTKHHLFQHQERKTILAHWLICSLWSLFPDASCPNCEGKVEAEIQKLCPPSCQCLPKLNSMEAWRWCEVVLRRETPPHACLGGSQSEQSAHSSLSREGWQNTYLAGNKKLHEHPGPAVEKCVYMCVCVCLACGSHGNEAVTSWIARHWNRLSREAGESTSLESLGLFSPRKEKAGLQGGSYAFQGMITPYIFSALKVTP